jgi:hypothetical protein
VVTKTDLEKLKIDVVDELHKRALRRKHARASSEEIEKAASKTLVKIKKTKKSL